MNINCMIVDDEPMARNLLKEYVSKISYINLLGTCSSAIEASEFLRSHTVDLMFLDIQMPDLTGISFLKSLQKKPMVVFTTAYSEYALESYDLDVVDYLLKPVTFERFMRAVDKVSQRMVSEPITPQEKHTVTEPNASFIFVKDGTKLVKVNWEDILYIEGLKDYVKIFLMSAQWPVITRMSMKSLEEKLPADRFCACINHLLFRLAKLPPYAKEELLC